jgi:hypothetical protein
MMLQFDFEKAYINAHLSLSTNAYHIRATHPIDVNTLVCYTDANNLKNLDENEARNVNVFASL